MENLEELLSLVPEDKRDDAKTFVSQQIEAEKTRGIEASNAKGKENATLRNRLNTLAKEVGYDSDSESWEDFESKLTNKLKSADETGLTLAQLNEKFEKLNNEYTNEVQKRLSKEKEINDNKIITKLNEDIGPKIWGSKALIENTILKKQLLVSEDGKIVTPDGKDYNTFVEQILEANKDNLKSDQTPGVNKTLKNNKPSSSEDEFINKFKSKMTR